MAVQHFPGGLNILQPAVGAGAEQALVYPRAGRFADGHHVVDAVRLGDLRADGGDVHDDLPGEFRVRI